MATLIKKCPYVITPDACIQLSYKIHGTSGISAYVLCKEDNNKHQSNGYMFSRTQTEYMQPYNNTTTNMKYYINRFNKEQELLDKGENNIEDEA